jgi:hypothetical protein
MFNTIRYFFFQGDAAMFMDQKEATEIQRRILESCSSKLRSLYNMFEQVFYTTFL